MTNGQNIQFLDNKQVIRGEVVHGMKAGRKLGFPTANLDQSPGDLENGVYGVYVRVNGQTHEGVMNIGVKPTFDSQFKRMIEVHLLEYTGDLYGEVIDCEFVFKIREERKFPSFEFLMYQIKEDVQYANEAFHHISAEKGSKHQAQRVS
ncbi:riboflavin kinase [Bacillus sp. 37MA]|uniref:riboflavin kinase n=1 Tax=Bacillus sp. 37MA TaxID=1132442 RepID=UPI00035D9713|nr:riboflavin kinase [Bacillus sp. 37MA]